MTDETYSYLAEWFDPQAETVRPYLLHYYADNTLEMVLSTFDTIVSANDNFFLQ